MEGLNGIQDATLASMNLPDNHPLGGIAMSGVAQINNPSKSISMEMGAVTFGIFVPSLAHPDVDSYQIAEVESPELRLDAGKTSELAVSGRLFHLEDWSISSTSIFGSSSSPSTSSPVTVMTSEKQLILGRLLTQFIEGKDSVVEIRALSKDINIPPWLSVVLKSITLNMIFPGSPSNDFIRSLDMGNIQFGFLNDNNSALLSGDLSSSLQLPPNVTFPVKVLKMKPKAYLKMPGGKNMATLHVPDFLTAISEQDGTSLGVEVELEEAPVTVIEEEREEFYRFLNASFNSDKFQFGIEGEARAMIECGLGTFELGPIGFDVITEQRGNLQLYI
jgi:hypothetical protein